MHRSAHMVPRRVPSSQQPIRGYAGHAQPVGSEAKCRRAALPVPSDLSQSSEGNCMQRGSENQEKTAEFTCEKEKNSWSTYPLEVRSQVTERRRGLRREPRQGPTSACSALIHREQRSGFFGGLKSLRFRTNFLP
ncbi:uncharacterized protein LOC111569849 isoform X2 [Amphiprion ocellaris]|uniref:uncharacterized protein LOC111569849 isoform X2 n=1 Tax=Amphiprion ocellaris TaxID=80972 RepID=UPI00241145EA|nr:uncharacterized protein LOC111569849 isoform X2 [Amphiprion ocellaris]